MGWFSVDIFIPLITLGPNSNKAKLIPSSASKLWEEKKESRYNFLSLVYIRIYIYIYMNRWIYMIFCISYTYIHSLCIPIYICTYIFIVHICSYVHLSNIYILWLSDSQSIDLHCYWIAQFCNWAPWNTLHHLITCW